MSSSEESANDANNYNDNNSRKKSSRDMKKRSKRKCTAHSNMPLWQQKLAHEIRQQTVSPSPSIKSRLRKLKDLTSSSSSSRSSIGQEEKDYEEEETVEEEDVKSEQSTQSFYELVKSIQSNSLDVDDEDNVNDETSFIHHSNNNNNNNTNNNENSFKKLEKYIEITESTNLFFDNIIENYEIAEDTKNTTSTTSPRNDEPFIYRNHFMENSQPLEFQMKKTRRPSQSESNRDAFNRKETLARKPNILRVKQPNQNESEFNVTPATSTQIRERKSGNESSFFTHAPVSDQMSNSTVTSLLPSVTYDNEYDGDNIVEASSIEISADDYQTNGEDTGNSDSVDEYNGKQHLGFFISEQDMSQCSGYSSFYDKSENELDAYFRKRVDNNNIETFKFVHNKEEDSSSILHQRSDQSVANNNTNNNDNNSEPTDGLIQYPNSITSAHMQTMNDETATILPIVERDYCQMRIEMNILRNEMRELKSGMVVLTELVQLSLNKKRKK